MFLMYSFMKLENRVKGRGSRHCGTRSAQFHAIMGDKTANLNKKGALHFHFCMLQERQSRQHHKLAPSQRIFTASEVAEYEYCPLTWWYEQYNTFVSTDTEVLFARTVALEHVHGPQATTLPEYQVIGQILLQRGAFEQGEQQHRAHAQAVAEIAEQDAMDSTLYATVRHVVGVLVVLALLCMIVAWLFLS